MQDDSLDLLLFLNFHILQEFAQPRISIDAVGVDDDPSMSISSRYSVNNRHVVRIARPLKPVMLNDGQLLCRKRPSTLHCA